MSKQPAHNFKDIPFPECAHDCALVEHLGCGECESACSWKFNADGSSKIMLTEQEASNGK
jgi:hypothetical protein